MPSVIENIERWQHHKWAQLGDEWSPGRCAEGTAILWYRTILPRIHRFVPTGTILEIGPGFGRWTQYLRQLCSKLILVDLSERCIDACRERFSADPHIEYIVNDGASLEMVPDRSVDFIFSFDSLVHAEADAVSAYVAQAARKLKPGGGGFVHHSNLRAFAHPRTGEIRHFVTKRNWRAESMAADTFRDACEKAGLACCSQELINWIGRGRHADRHRLPGQYIPLTDCLSVFAHDDGARRAAKQIANHAFVDEWRQAVWMSEMYGNRAASSTAIEAPSGSPSWMRKLRTAIGIMRRDGLAAFAGFTYERAAATAEFVASAIRARLLGEANRWFSLRHIGR